MGRQLIHGYYDIDYDIVWLTATTYLPPLVTALTEMLAAGQAGNTL